MTTTTLIITTMNYPIPTTPVSYPGWAVFSTKQHSTTRIHEPPETLLMTSSIQPYHVRTVPARNTSARCGRKRGRAGSVPGCGNIVPVRVTYVRPLHPRYPCSLDVHGRSTVAVGIITPRHVDLCMIYKHHR